MAEAVGKACCNHSKPLWSCRLMTMAMSLGGLAVSAREGNSTGVVVGTEVAVDKLSGCMLLRSTSISCGLWVGSPGSAMSQRGSLWKVNYKASSLLFKPSRHTTMSLCCNSLCICSWWSQPQATMLGMPSVIVLMCPSLNRATWKRASFSQTKAYA